MAHYIPKDPLLWRIMHFAKKHEIGCLVFLLVFPSFLTMAPLVGWRHIRKRERFYQRMLANKRIISWEDFLNRTAAQEGTIIMEFGNKAASRFWWTPDLVRSTAPMPPPQISELNWIAYGGKEHHPFARWCYEQYLNPEDGRALMAYPAQPGFETWPRGKDYEEQMKNRFPRQEIIILTFYDARYV